MNLSKPAKWFRMYAEFLNDPKVQMLSEQDQRRYIMLLCIRCSNGDVTLQDSEVAFQLRISEQEWLSTKQVLLKKCLITELSTPTAWEKRQFASDTSAERVARHREAHKVTANTVVTLQKRSVETETEKETENKTHLRKPAKSKQKHKQTDEAFAAFWKAFPRKRNKGDAYKAWVQLSPDEDLIAAIMASIERGKASNHWREDGGKYIKYPASWLRAECWEDQYDEAKYGSDQLYVMQIYNNTLAPTGWPEASEQPYSQERDAAITDFKGFSNKPGFIAKYFGIVSETLKPFPGCGFDWVIKRETFLKIKEDVYGVAA